MSDASEAPPFEFRAPLSVCLDVRHPQAYLALGPVQALAQELGIDVDWLPFPVSPPQGPPPAGEDRGTRHRRARAERGDRHRRARAEYQAREIALYAAVLGLTIEQPFRSGDATPAALALLWLRQRPVALPEFLGRLFEGYWDRSLNAADPGAVAALLQALGHDGEAFRGYVSGPGPNELDELRARLVAAGVFTVPSLVVADEVFVGRAHLPMVRWLLTGRDGPAPI